jgi:acylphosphatase
MLSRFHAYVSGRVQGVAFRYYAEREALGLGLTGWVRNRRDGRVEVVAEGRKDDLENYVERLREGPRMARVEKLDIQWEGPSGEYSDFRIVFTALD